MPESMPITPKLLTWARQRAGLTLEQAEKKYKRFAEWENGTSAPTYPQLEQLAEAFKLPIAVFFFPAPPNLPPIGETFRTLPESELDNLPTKIRFLLRKAKSLQLNLGELSEYGGASQRLITKDISATSEMDLQSLAISVRNYLGISIEDQISWSTDDIALKEWRAALHRAGVFVFKDAFQNAEYSGFCLYDKDFPVIYVNNSSAKTRQSFTFFHELAHLLFHTSGIDTLSDRYISRLGDKNQTIEILCNQFAAEFLLPERVFSVDTASRPKNEATAELLAGKYHVSREVIFRRFLTDGHITESQYKAAAKRWNEQQKSKSGDGNHYWTKLTYLGREYVSLALSKFHQNKIDEEKLAEYLDVKPKNLGKFEEYFYKGVS